MVVITAFQRDIIFDAVQAMYTDVARHPERTFHFPTGRSTCLAVGYPAAELDRIPATAVESFAGVGYPFAAGVIEEGDEVLDIGSGSGTDALLASLAVGERGRVHALDMTRAMRDKLAVNASEAGRNNIEILDGNAEAIPLPDASVDVVTSNGVLNLVPDKATAMTEIARVLRPGGRIQIADIVLATDPSEACRSQPRLWAECICRRDEGSGLHRIAGGRRAAGRAHPVPSRLLPAQRERRDTQGGRLIRRNRRGPDGTSAVSDRCTERRARQPGLAHPSVRPTRTFRKGDAP